MSASTSSASLAKSHEGSQPSPASANRPIVISPTVVLNKVKVTDPAAQKDSDSRSQVKSAGSNEPIKMLIKLNSTGTDKSSGAPKPAVVANSSSTRSEQPLPKVKLTIPPTNNDRNANPVAAKHVSPATRSPANAQAQPVNSKSSASSKVATKTPETSNAKSAPVSLKSAENVARSTSTDTNKSAPRTPVVNAVCKDAGNGKSTGSAESKSVKKRRSELDSLTMWPDNRGAPSKKTAANQSLNSSAISDTSVVSLSAANGNAPITKSTPSTTTSGKIKGDSKSAVVVQNHNSAASATPPNRRNGNEMENGQAKASASNEKPSKPATSKGLQPQKTSEPDGEKGKVSSATPNANQPRKSATNETSLSEKRKGDHAAQEVSKSKKLAMAESEKEDAKKKEEDCGDESGGNAQYVPVAQTGIIVSTRMRFGLSRRQSVNRLHSNLDYRKAYNASK